jgi:alkylation response protein AidB-like acyl-CoA dehydrogenase
VELVAAQRLVHVRDLRDNPTKVFAWFEALGYFDHSCALKFAVQYNLWGGTILFLGSREHHERFLDKITSCEALGVFGLTELGHGSNVNGMETTATYDRARDEFVVHSPTFTAQKYWPGNIAEYGQFATVFARLVIDGKDCGPHGFVVPIRDGPRGKPLPGVTVRDSIGQKLCFNGVDNGGLLFNQVRVPRSALLDRFSAVEAGGHFRSDLPKDQLFGKTMGVFLPGRICIALLALAGLKVGLAVAVSYGETRKQFGPRGSGAGGEAEVPIMTHLTHQRRLMPALARTYALDAALKYIGARLAATHDGSARLEVKAVHAHAAGIKAVVSWDATRLLQTARECLGGQGIRAANLVGPMRDHVDMYCTGEGDNVVLMNQVTRFLLDEWKRQSRTKQFCGELAYVARIVLLLERRQSPQSPAGPASLASGKTASAAGAGAASGSAGGTSGSGGGGGSSSSGGSGSGGSGGGGASPSGSSSTSAKPRLRARSSAVFAASRGLKDFEWQSTVLEAAEYVMLASLAGKLEAAAGAGDRDPFFVWNDHLPQIQALAAVHVERIAHREFVAAVQRFERSPLAEAEALRVLELMAHLNALSSIAAQSGFLLSNGLLRAEDARSLDDAITRACVQLRPHAMSLVTAFDLPAKSWPLRGSLE